MNLTGTTCGLIFTRLTSMLDFDEKDCKTAWTGQLLNTNLY